MPFCSQKQLRKQFPGALKPSPLLLCHSWSPQARQGQAGPQRQHSRARAERQAEGRTRPCTAMHRNREPHRAQMPQGLPQTTASTSHRRHSRTSPSLGTDTTYPQGYTGWISSPAYYTSTFEVYLRWPKMPLCLSKQDLQHILHLCSLKAHECQYTQLTPTLLFLRTVFTQQKIWSKFKEGELLQFSECPGHQAVPLKGKPRPHPKSHVTVGSVSSHCNSSGQYAKYKLHPWRLCLLETMPVKAGKSSSIQINAFWFK